MHQRFKSTKPAKQTASRRWCFGLNAWFVPATLVTGVLVLLLSTGSLLNAAQKLPSMGEPADASLSPIAERQLGEQFMRRVRASVPMIRDVQLSEYMQLLGMRLSSNVAETRQHQYEFFVINNPNINAFAIPGGFIGINSGLIEAMQIEDQLAAVVGHEIAHITQRHHARSVASSSRTRMTTAFAVLAAILIGQSNPEAGQAALAAGLAATQQSVINFTRNNEYEADRIGIEILANASYNPTAMAEAFDILRRKNSLNQSSNQLEYLRTHPLDNTRIAEAKNRATALSARSNRAVETPFTLFKARLKILTTRDLASAERFYRSRLTSDNPATRDGANYAMGILALERQRYDEAEKHLDALGKQTQRSLFAQLLRADLLFSRGQASQAFTLLEALQSVYPENFSVIQLHYNKLVDSRQLTAARGLILEYIRSTQRPNNFAWRELASIEQKLGKESASHEALSRYFTTLYNPQRAREQLLLAIRSVQKGSNDELRLRARLRELEPGEN